MKRALIVAATGGFLNGFLIPDMKLLQEMGYEVHCAANGNSVSTFVPEERFASIGVTFHQIDFSSTSPISKESLTAYKQYKELLNRYHFDFVHVHINNNAGSTHIEGLQKFVVEKGLDVGFAYDGDADRCLCVDEKGNVITGDHILYIYGCYMKERGKLLTNTVVTTVMSNFGLYKAFDEQGIGYAKTAVGDKYVYEYMAKNGCRIGGEQSGHIIFSKYASTGDGILTSLKMMEVMLAKKKPMSELAAPLKIYPQVLENVRVTDKKAAQNDPAVQEAVSKVAEALGDTGRILVRESGTEPVVRVMVEAPDHNTCQKYVDEVVNVICEKGYKA